MRDLGFTRGYLDGLGLRHVGIEPASDWRAAEALLRSADAGTAWWEAEEAQRRQLMRQARERAGDAALLEALASAVEGHVESTFAMAVASCGDEALARVASGAALAALDQRALALLAGCGESHAFVQKYALFDAGRFPLGLRGTSFILF